MVDNGGCANKGGKAVPNVQFPQSSGQHGGNVKKMVAMVAVLTMVAKLATAETLTMLALVALLTMVAVLAMV